MTLPNFIIIGVAKAGTTSLYRYLDQHPQVYMCPTKETNFFAYEDARNWNLTNTSNPPSSKRFRIKTLEDYQALFEGVSNELAIGEASPQYFGSPTAARRICTTIPHVKLVAIMRNPAERAYSGFLMRTRRGEVVMSMYDELNPESNHVKVGYYYHQLKRYTDVFPKEQIKIYLFEEFKEDPDNLLANLFGYLEVDPNYRPDTSVKYNSAAIPKYRLLNRILYNSILIRAGKKVLPSNIQEKVKQGRKQSQIKPPEFPDDLRAKLISLYREDILKLEELLERDLSLWLDTQVDLAEVERNYV